MVEFVVAHFDLQKTITGGLLRYNKLNSILLSTFLCPPSDVPVKLPEGRH